MREVSNISNLRIFLEALLLRPPLELYKELLEEFPNLHILAKGGVRNLSDIRTLKKIGLHSVIFGSSFYEGRITLKELSDFIANSN